MSNNTIKIKDEYLAAYLWKICKYKYPEVKDGYFIFEGNGISESKLRSEFEDSEFGAYDVGVAKMKRARKESECG